MSNSKEGIRELCLDVDRILIDGDRHNDKIISLEDLQNRLRRKAKFKEIDFQSKYEGDDSLEYLLLKYATEDDNSRVKDFLLKNGCKPLPQEQTAPVINKEEEEQNTPDVEKNRADSNTFATSYKKIKEIVTQNPNITAEEFDDKLKKEKIDKEITNQDGWTLLYYAVHSEGPYITDGRDIFLKIVELFTNLNIGSILKILLPELHWVQLQ